MLPVLTDCVIRLKGLGYRGEGGTKAEIPRIWPLYFKLDASTVPGIRLTVSRGAGRVRIMARFERPAAGAMAVVWPAGSTCTEEGALGGPMAEGEERDLTGLRSAWALLGKARPIPLRWDVGSWCVGVGQTAPAWIGCWAVPWKQDAASISDSTTSDYVAFAGRVQRRVEELLQASDVDLSDAMAQPVDAARVPAAAVCVLQDHIATQLQVAILDATRFQGPLREALHTGAGPTVVPDGKNDPAGGGEGNGRGAEHGDGRSGRRGGDHAPAASPGFWMFSTTDLAVRQTATTAFRAEWRAGDQPTWQLRGEVEAHPATAWVSAGLYDSDFDDRLRLLRRVLTTRTGGFDSALGTAIRRAAESTVTPVACLVGSSPALRRAARRAMLDPLSDWLGRSGFDDQCR